MMQGRTKTIKNYINQKYSWYGKNQIMIKCFHHRALLKIAIGKLTTSGKNIVRINSEKNNAFQLGMKKILKRDITLECALLIMFSNVI